jgi:hypothetical protein
MKKVVRRTVLSCLLAAPLLAQTTIGGGSCSSATVNGAYAVSITGRQVTSAGNFNNVFQANGAATFDGLSKVTVTLTADTGPAVGSPLTWSGTYSIQANCAGAITITSGGSATFNLILYSGGSDFLITGNDPTYAYSGSGVAQPTGCSASLLTGVYNATTTGYSLSAGSVSGAAAAAALLQFDGIGSVTVNLTMPGTATVSALTGSYSISSNCLGSAHLTDSKGGAYAMSISVYSATKTYSSNFYVSLGQSAKLIISGSAHAVYGQPAASAGYFAPGGLRTKAEKSLAEARGSGFCVVLAITHSAPILSGRVDARQWS